MNLTASCSYRVAMARLIFKWPNMRSILLTGLLNRTHPVRPALSGG